MKDPVPLLHRSGIYVLQCSDCPTIYVGQTGRRLQTRLAEHEKAIEKRTPEKSNFASHILTADHTFSSDTGVRLLHTAEKSKRLSALENIEIIKLKYSTFSIANEIIPTSTLADSFYDGNTTS